MSALASFAALGDTRRAILGIAGFGAAWAVLEGVLGARLQGHYHLLQVVWCRYAVHLATLGLLFGWRRPDRLWRTARPAYQLTRSMLMLVMPASFVLSLDVGMASNTTWSVFWLSPVLVIIFARAMLGERASWSQWAMAAIGAAVVAFMLDPSPPASLPLLVIAVVMALSFSVYVVMTRSLASGRVLANLFYTAFGVFLALTPFMPLVWVTPSWQDAVLLIGIGVLILIALFALDRSASLAPVSFTAPILYLQVVSIALVDLLNGHSLSRRTLAGSAVIIAIAGFQWLRTARAYCLIPGEPISQPIGQGEHPLAHRHPRQNRLDELAGVLRHPSAPATRAESPDLAREGHQTLERAPEDERRPAGPPQTPGTQHPWGPQDVAGRCPQALHAAQDPAGPERGSDAASLSAT